MIDEKGWSGKQQWLRDARRAEVVTLRRRGLVPLAIAEVLGWSIRSVASYLREAEALGEIDPTPRGMLGSIESNT